MDATLTTSTTFPANLPKSVSVPSFRVSGIGYRSVMEGVLGALFIPVIRCRLPMVLVRVGIFAAGLVSRAREPLRWGWASA